MESQALKTYNYLSWKQIPRNPTYFCFQYGDIKNSIQGLGIYRVSLMNPSYGTLSADITDTQPRNGDVMYLADLKDIPSAPLH